ncbi:MAG: Re/Si-specific NAD(P)(+) transhydrogenase subunit alpha [Chitinophagaceae bacterium]|nr:Re/Si-specific NAD(P)(+) transhydrogenase subunit alpha [Chitinophagaceae bacterium]
MILGILREPEFESRVSMTDESVSQLTKKGIQVYVEKQAGAKAFCEDAQYEAAGARLHDRADILKQSDLLLSIHPPVENEISLLNKKVLVGVYQPLYHPQIMKAWASAGLTVFSLDMLPRTTRAQAMDILSSQANIAGYKAVILAAQLYPRYFPMFMTAAGSIKPAKVLVLGAGVAGLQAIATARRLGAVVEVFDTRPVVKEEVMSLGAKFIEVEGAADASAAGGYAVEQSEEYQRRQKQKIAESIAKADIVITTAQIPGKKAPVLITEEMLNTMRKGSVIIDIAAATGGNTPFTKNNEIINYNGITIVGNSNLAATMPYDASRLYGKNVLNFLQLIIENGQLRINRDDDLVAGCCITHNGEVVHEKIKSLL